MITTDVLDGDSAVAFSISSASMCTTSLTAGAPTAMPGCASSKMRSYSSISDTAALITSAGLDRPVRMTVGQLLTGQNEQILRVAAHAGADVVQLEQACETLGAVFTLLKIIYKTDLAFHKALAAAGSVSEHRVEFPAEPGLADS